MVSRVITFVLAVAALAASVICYNLTVKHIFGSSGMAWFEAACSDGSEAGKASCSRVLNSKYSYVPPKDPEKPDGGIHVPASLLGLFYYSSIFVWLVGVGRPSYAKRWIHALPLLLVGAGLVFSAYFIVVMYQIISEWCPWCLVTHVLNLVIALGLIALWPRKAGAMGDMETTGIDAATKDAPHPTGRQLAITVLAALCLIYGHFFHLGWREQKKNVYDMKAELDFLRSNVGGYIAQWQLAPPCAVATRPDEAYRPFSKSAGDHPVLDVVIFSDFECPACARFARFFDTNVPRLFDQRLRVVFRHYPLDQSCNSGSVKTMHPHACDAAFLAEGARALGGSESFWKAHDFLFEHQSDIASGKMTAKSVAEAIGLDAVALQHSAAKAAVMPRISQDLEQVRTCSLRATPGIFVEGRRIESAAASNVEFWDKLADWFWREKAKEARPQTTRIPAPTPPTQQG